MYVMFADGNTMRRRDIQKVVLHLVQSGRIFRKILNVRYVLQAKTSFQRLNKNETRILYWNKYDRIDIILENLRDYTVKHFTDEEQYMESINYKKLFTQKVQHLKFIHKLDEFIEHHNDEIEDQDEQIMVICVESADRGQGNVQHVSVLLPFCYQLLSFYYHSASFFQN